ncbi:MAG: tetratricopeptide repeat protein [Gemmatimonadetes bacterium]|nr:tetratricopeptide repeat protein [Gemmatimonadota bacterium]
MIDSMQGVARYAASMALAFVCAAAPAVAQAGRAQAREGNRLYEQGQFDEAHQRYLEGLAAAPGSGVLLFNYGNALYRSEDYQRAMEAYQRAIDTNDPALVSEAWYNLGNALYRQQQLEPALEAYKQALRLSPSDVDAKHNLERVLQEMQQQQQQQNQDQQNQDQQDQQNENQQNQDQQNQQNQQDQQDQNQQSQPRDQQDGNQPPPQGRGSPEPRPGQMTPEQAERLLQSVQENPDSVNRPRAPATGVRPRRPW